jgi:hypothetical protein
MNVSPTAAWYTQNITPTAITAGTYYVLACLEVGESNSINSFYYDSGGAHSLNDSFDRSYTLFPATWPGSNIQWSSEMFSGYLTYTTSGGSAPVASFSYTTAVVRNGTVTLTDSSTNTPTSWLWYGKSASNIPMCAYNSTNQNDKFFPKNFSWCNLCMMATNAQGSDTTCHSVYVMQPWVVW